MIEVQILLDDLRNVSDIEIGSIKYKIFAGAKYVTQNNRDNEYYKIFLSEKSVIVISLIDNLVSFGCDVGKIDEIDLNCDEIDYRNKIFRMIDHDNQMLDSVIFGNSSDVEKEVEFWDYLSNDSTSIISVGVDDNKKRCDVISDIISPHNISKYFIY